MRKITKIFIIVLVIIAVFELLFLIKSIGEQLNIDLLSADYEEKYVEPVNFEDVSCRSLWPWKNKVSITGEVVKITKEQYNYNEIHVSSRKTEHNESKKEIFPTELHCDEAYFFNYYIAINSDAGPQYRSEVYLECVYEIDTYNEEIERLGNINEEWSEYTKRSVYVEDLFNLPAYVTIYNDDGKFVYALLDSSANRIIYIAFHDVKTIDNIVFDRAYAPYKDINDSSFPKELIHPRYKFYNMYAWYGM